MQKNREIFHTKWLENQGISAATQDAFGIHSVQHPRVGAAIAFPVYDLEGNFLFNKYRRDPRTDFGPKYLYDSGTTAELYGGHLISDHETILITEGEKDCLSAWSQNIPAVSSTGGAMTFKEDWVSLLKSREIILCFDNDAPGGKGMAKLVKRLPNVWVVLIPDKPNVKDLSDYVSSGGDIHELLRTKKRLSSVSSVQEDRSNRLALWQSVHFHDAYLEISRSLEPKQPGKYLGNDKISQAKSYPIPNLIKIPQSKKICCPWHKEKTPSLHYYEESNSFYCFGQCGRAYDSIDLYRHLHPKSSFKQAIDFLSSNQNQNEA